MAKRKNNESGFGTIELVLLVVVVVLLGAAGYLVYKNQHKTTTTTPTTNSNNSKPASATPSIAAATSYTGWGMYTSADKVYSVDYPKGWVTDPDCAPDNCADGAVVDMYFNPSADPTRQTISVGHKQTSQTAQDWFDQFENIPSQYNCVYDANSNSINSYQTYYAKLYAVTNIDDTAFTCPTTAPALSNSDGTVSDNYAIAHDGQVVWLQMTIHSASTGEVDTSALVPTFNQIVSSVKIN